MEQRANDVGTVLAVGRTAWWAHREINDEGQTVNGKPWAKPGDRVLFSTYAGRDVPRQMREQIDPTANKIIVANDEDVLLVL